MPAAYSHFRFGQDVYGCLSEELQSIVSSAKDVYNIGLYGPDIFFYRHATLDSISRFGFSMHKRDAYSFFQDSLGKAHTETELAYLFGFLCHFELDRACHRYIKREMGASKGDEDGRMKKQGGKNKKERHPKRLHHLQAEAELDRTLLIADGVNPYCYPMAEGVVITKQAVEIIHCFFPDFSERGIHGALRDMKRFQRFMTAKGDGKRLFLQVAFGITGLYPILYSLVIRKRPHPDYLVSCRELRQLYFVSVKRAAALLEEYYETWVKEGTLSGRFHGSFAGEMDIRKLM